MDEREHDHGPDRRERIPTRGRRAPSSGRGGPRDEQRRCDQRDRAECDLLLVHAEDPERLPPLRSPQSQTRPTGASASERGRRDPEQRSAEGETAQEQRLLGPNQAKSRANFGTASTVNAGSTARPACTTDWRRPRARGSISAVSRDIPTTNTSTRSTFQAFGPTRPCGRVEARATARSSTRSSSA